MKPQFGITGEKKEKLLDFGCGEGTNLEFFHKKGFDVYGVDISELSIQKCKEKMPEIADHFMVIPSEPKKDDVFFGGDFDVVIGIQSFYYYNDEDMQTRFESIYNMMKDNAIIYATMIGTKCSQYYDNSTECDDGINLVKFNNTRLDVDEYYVNFTEDENDLINKFKLFKKEHVGFYDSKYREDEGTDFHYIFIGKKEINL